MQKQNTATIFKQGEFGINKELATKIQELVLKLRDLETITVNNVDKYIYLRNQLVDYLNMIAEKTLQLAIKDQKYLNTAQKFEKTLIKNLSLATESQLKEATNNRATKASNNKQSLPKKINTINEVSVNLLKAIIADPKYLSSSAFQETIGNLIVIEVDHCNIYQQARYLANIADDQELENIKESGNGTKYLNKPLVISDIDYRGLDDQFRKGSIEHYIKTECPIQNVLLQGISLQAQIHNLQEIINQIEKDFPQGEKVVLMALADGSFTEPFILYFNNGKLTEMIRSKSPHKFEAMESIVNNSIKIHKIFPLQHSGNCTKYTELALIEFYNTAYIDQYFDEVRFKAITQYNFFYDYIYSQYNLFIQQLDDSNDDANHFFNQDSFTQYYCNMQKLDPELPNHLKDSYLQLLKIIKNFNDKSDAILFYNELVNAKQQLTASHVGHMNNRFIQTFQLYKNNNTHIPQDYNFPYLIAQNYYFGQSVVRDHLEPLQKLWQQLTFANSQELQQWRREKQQNNANTPTLIEHAVHKQNLHGSLKGFYLRDGVFFTEEQAPSNQYLQNTKNTKLRLTGPANLQDPNDRLVLAMKMARRLLKSLAHNQDTKRQIIISCKPTTTGKQESDMMHLVVGALSEIATDSQTLPKIKFRSTDHTWTKLEEVNEEKSLQYKREYNQLFRQVQTAKTTAAKQVTQIDMENATQYSSAMFN